jgi:hypothetical protein
MPRLKKQRFHLTEIAKERWRKTKEELSSDDMSNSSDIDEMWEAEPHIDTEDKHLLKWVNEAEDNLFKRTTRYEKNSRTTIWRREKSRSETLKLVPMKKITSFFNKEIHEVRALDEKDCLAQESHITEEQNFEHNSKRFPNNSALETSLDSISQLLKTRKSNISFSETIKYLAIARFLELRLKGHTKKECSKLVCENMPISMKRCERTVRTWTLHYIFFGKLPISKQGKHQKTTSLLNDEDFQKDCIDWLRNQPSNKRTPKAFNAFLANELIPSKFGVQNISKISERTANNWMHKIGYIFGTWKKGVYIDGHERKDVVEYRKEFCERMIELFKKSKYYEGNSMDIVIEPELSGEREIVWVTHDESVFYANDDGGRGWSDESHPDLHKKAKGRSIMVSEYLCPCHGRLFLTNLDGSKTAVCTTLTIGKGQEGYWTFDHVVDQLRNKLIPAFEQMHPNCKARIIFDQSTNHAAYAPDALLASRMNLKEGGKQSFMRDGWYIDQKGDKKIQKMQFVELDNGIHKMAAKGMKKVLEERELWTPSMKMICNQKDVVIIPGVILSCCATHCLSSSPDFQEQKSYIEETISLLGHECDFYPKFHCEMNPIESFWGACKQYARASCDYSFNSLKENVPLALSSVANSTIRKYFRRCSHYIQAYSLGLDYKMAKFSHKKYKSHRRIPQNMMEEIEKSMN